MRHAAQNIYSAARRDPSRRAALHKGGGRSWPRVIGWRVCGPATVRSGNSGAEKRNAGGSARSGRRARRAGATTRAGRLDPRGPGECVAGSGCRTCGSEHTADNAALRSRRESDAGRSRSATAAFPQHYPARRGTRDAAICGKPHFDIRDRSRGRPPRQRGPAYANPRCAASGGTPAVRRRCRAELCRVE